MSTLFTINKSWHGHTPLYENCAYASDGDAILLIEDGVLAMSSALTLKSFVAKCEARKIALYALESHLHVRGLENHYPQIELIDYARFVDLIMQHDKQMVW